MRLVDRIWREHAAATAWVVAGNPVSRTQVVAQYIADVPRIDDLAGESVVVQCSDHGHLLRWLVLLDGIAGQILVLPDHLTDRESERLIEQSRCKRRVADEYTELAARWGQTVATHEVYRGDPADAGLLASRSNDTRWVIPTSGTTDKPKLVSHTLKSLTRSLKIDSSVGSDLIWGLLYHPTSFAGLQVVLQALCGGSTLVVPPEMRDIESVIHEFVSWSCSGLSSTPSMWRRLLMAQRVEELALRHITMGGEIADQRLLSAVTSRFPDSTVRHVYGSTEAGIGFSIADGLAGFPTQFLDGQRHGIELAIDNDGCLLVRRPECEQRYLGEAAAISDAEGWINTGDLVVRAGDRCHFIGRENGSINVGGRKVHPQEVEAAILEVPGVSIARVFGRKNSVLGSVVEAEIVADHVLASDTLCGRVKDHCSATLADFKRPILVRMVDSIDVTPAGKIQRK